MFEQVGNSVLIARTTEIVSAYVSKKAVIATDLPDLIANLGAALAQVAAQATQRSKEELTPAVPIKNSVTPDAVV